MLQADRAKRWDEYCRQASQRSERVGPKGPVVRPRVRPGSTQLPPASWLSRFHGGPAAAEGLPPACRYRPQAAARLRRCSPQHRLEHPPRCRCCRPTGPRECWCCPGVCPAPLQPPMPAQGQQLALQGSEGRVGGGKRDGASQPGAPSPLPLPAAGAQAAQAAQAGQPSRQTLHWQNRLEGQGCRLHPPTRGLTLWLRQRWHADGRGAVGQGQRAALALGHCSSSRARDGSAGVKSMPITAGAGSKQPSLPGQVDPLLQSNAGCRATLTPISDNGRTLIAQLQVVAPSGIPPRLVPALRRRCAGSCLFCRKCLQGV